MLGFLRGLEQGVVREGAAQRQHQTNVLSSKENHLDRLLNQIKYNREMKYRQDRAARHDFVTDRAYNRGVLESDRNYQFRQNADTRAEEVHDFNYGEGGMMPLRRRLLEGEIEEWDANAANRALQRKRDAAYLNYDMGLGLDTRAKADALTREQYTEYLKDAPIRDLNRRHLQKLGEYNLGEGWNEFLENQDLEQRLKEAQIGYYNRRPTSTSSGGVRPPTWAQQREIAIEEIAPSLLKFLEDEGEAWTWNPLKNPGFIHGFQVDRPYTSTNPNEVTQTMLLKKAGAYLMQTLTEQTGDPVTAAKMVVPTFEQILNTEGSDVLKRLMRTSGAEGYDQLELRRKFNDIVHQGALNYAKFGQWNRPAGDAGAASEADKLLDTIQVE